MHDDERDIYLDVINRFIGYHSRKAQLRTANDTSREYPFVAMDTRQVFAQIGFVHRFLQENAPGTAPWSFLDIGAGIGNVLLIAEVMGFDVFGIEKDPYPCRIARELVGEERVAAVDIWAFDAYGRFDVIYYFRPFHHGDTQRRFELMVEDTLRVGGLLIANRKMNTRIERDGRFVRLHPGLPVWRKVGGGGQG